MKIIVIGNGGHSKVIQEMISNIKGYRVIGVLDDKYTHITETEKVIYGPLYYFDTIMNDRFKVIIAIGNNLVRKDIVNRLNIPTTSYLTLIHPTAVVSESAKIGFGTVVMNGAFVTAEALIGHHTIINTSAIIEHENRIGDFVHVSPNATLTGNVSIGEGVHLGASATVIPGIKINRWSVIGAGSTVINDIPAYRKAVGSPTQLIKNIHVDQKIKDKVVMLNDE